MIPAIRPLENQPNVQQADNTSKSSCVQRVWDAVVEFFTVFATIFANGLKIVPNFLMEIFFQVTPVEPDIDLPAGTLEEKLNLFKSMPVDPTNFVYRAITIFQATLRKKEKEYIAALVTGPFREEDLPFTQFNENFEGVDPACFAPIALAIVRAYTFSDSYIDFPFFYQTERVPVGASEPAVVVGNVVIHAGGQQMEDKVIDRGDRLLELRELFYTLPDDEKEIILDHTDLGGFKQLNLSKRGEATLQELSAISNKLSQQNGGFMDIVQAVHRRKFPSAR